MPFFAGQNRDQMRRMYLEAWRKFNARAPLEPLEAQLAAVIAEHPEYVTWLEAGETALGAEFTPEGGQQNPFLHMGLHLAIREQVATNRPAGNRGSPPEACRPPRCARGRARDAGAARRDFVGSAKAGADAWSTRSPTTPACGPSWPRPRWPPRSTTRPAGRPRPCCGPVRRWSSRSPIWSVARTTCSSGSWSDPVEVPRRAECGAAATADPPAPIASGPSPDRGTPSVASGCNNPVSRQQHPSAWQGAQTP